MYVGTWDRKEDFENMAIFRYSGDWRSYLEGRSSTVSQDIGGNSSVIKVDVWIGMDAGWSIEVENTYGNTVTVNCDGQSQTIAVGSLSLNGSKKYLGSDFSVFFLIFSQFR